jgi:hypothetical protein
MFIVFIVMMYITLIYYTFMCEGLEMLNVLMLINIQLPETGSLCMTITG